MPNLIAVVRNLVPEMDTSDPQPFRQGASKEQTNLQYEKTPYGMTKSRTLRTSRVSRPGTAIAHLKCTQSTACSVRKGFRRVVPFPSAQKGWLGEDEIGPRSKEPPGVGHMKAALLHTSVSAWHPFPLQNVWPFKRTYTYSFRLSPHVQGHGLVGVVKNNSGPLAAVPQTTLPTTEF